MPISPYSGQIYSGYSTGRPYTSSTRFNSNYSPSNVPSGYKLSNSNSSYALRTPTPVRKPILLAGNTAALKKTFSDASVSGLSGESAVSFHDNLSSLRRYNGVPSYDIGSKRDNDDISTSRAYTRRPTLLDIKEDDKKYKYDSKPYTSKYSSYFSSKDDESQKPKDIDARKINVSGRAPSQQSTSSEFRRREQDSSSISRNRQVVRLTIKREKEKEKRPLVLPENSVKTIAQRLFEKYTIIDKKKDSPATYIPKTKVQETVPAKAPLPKVIDKPPKLPITKDSLSNVVYSAKKPSKEDESNDGDDEQSSDEEEIEIVKREKDAAARSFVRATKAATTDKDLHNPQEVKDAIIAAVLHPGVDIESDEEIKKLVEEDSDRERSSSTKKKRKTSENKYINKNVLKKREKSDSELGGDMIVDKLKRYVKHQVSIKKESLKNISRKSSKEKIEESKPLNVNINDNIVISNTNNNNKPKERIIPIILQDEISSNINENLPKEINYYNNKEFEIKINSILPPESSIKAKSINNKNDCDKSTSKMSLPLNEEKSIIKNDKESWSKSFEPVYQTTQEAVSQVLPRPFQTSFQLSGEHSITHPENKVPVAPIFFTDSVPVRDGTGKEILLSDLNIYGKKDERNETKAKTLLKDIKNSEAIINEYEFELGRKGKKNNAEFQSQLDNSIKPESSSSYLKREKKLKIFDPREQELNYDIEKENENKEFKGSKIESEKMYLKGESPITYFEDDTKEIIGRKIKSNVSDILDTKKNNLDLKSDKREIPSHRVPEKQHSLVKRMPMNSSTKVINNKNKLDKELSQNKYDNNELGNVEIQLEKASLPLTKSKTTFLKSLVAQNTTEGQTKQLGVNQFDLQKSATTQNVNCGKSVNIKSPNDSESLSSNNVRDLEMKPSLKLFLDNEDKKTVDVSTSAEKNLTSTQTLSVTSNQDKATKQNEVTKRELATKQEETNYENSLKPPKQILPPPLESKTNPNEFLNARNVLKRPIKTEEVSKQSTKGSINVELKPKKIWKKPLPSEDTPKLSGNTATSSTPSLNKLINEPKTSFRVKPKATKLEEQTPLQSIKSKQQNLEVSPSNSKVKSSNTNKKLTVTSTKNDIDNKPRPTDTSNDRQCTLESKVNTKQSSQKQCEDTEPISTVLNKDNEGVKNKLSTSHSADSAYGSSPSTPYPRGATMIGGKRISEEKNESPKQQLKENEAEEAAVENTNEICEFCGTNCHKKCEKQMANLCGVNQKLLAEALSSVKKDGKDSFRILPTAVPGSKSASSVSSAEGDTTTTDDEETETDTDSSEYNGPAEVRSPIQTKPKYKKYGIDDFNFIKVLGKGSFGKVMLAQQVRTENYFAVKCLKKDVVLEDNDVECCLIERKVLTLGTKHPYLCHLFCSFQTPSHLFFVMEYLTGGDLMFHIQRVGRFDEYRACFYAAEITSGLKFLHNKGIIYRDLKLDNILLDYQGHIRIADFGMCKLQIYLDRFADTFCGTPDYMAPEVIKGLHYNQCVDWWSFGVLLYEMMVGKSPFKGCDEDHLFWLICNEEPFYPRFLSREAQSLLKQLLEKDATRRIGPPYCQHGEIQCHVFFKYIDWGKIERKEVETPYKPRLRHILDVQYFDRTFTKRNAAITPLDDSILDTMDQTPFKEFSYTNPNITD